MMNYRLNLKSSYGLAFSADSKYLATMGTKNIVIWDLEKKKKIVSVAPLKNPSHLDYSPNGKMIAAKNTAGQIMILNSMTGEAIKDFKNMAEGEGCEAIFSNDAKHIIDGSWGGVLSVRESKTGKKIMVENYDDALISGICCNANRETFAYVVSPKALSGTKKPEPISILIRKWPFIENKASVFLRKFNFNTEIALDPAAERIAVVYGAPPENLEVWDLKTEKILFKEKVKSGGTGTSIAWSSDGLLLAFNSNNDVVVKSAADYREVFRMKIEYLSSIRFSNNGLLAMGSWSKGAVAGVTI